VSRTIIRMIKYLVIFIFSVFFLVWLCSPIVIRHYLSGYLHQQQLVLSQGSSIRYNPFITQIEILDLTLTKSKGSKKKVLSLQKLTFKIRPYQLMFETIEVSEFIIDGLYLHIEQNKDALEISGLILPPSSSADSSNNNDNSTIKTTEVAVEFPFLIKMPALTLKNSQLDIILNGHQHQVQINSLLITDVNASLVSQSFNISIDSEINQSALALNINANVENESGAILLGVNLSKLELSRFQHLLPPTVTKLAGQVSYSAKHKVNFVFGNIPPDNSVKNDTVSHNAVPTKVAVNPLVIDIFDVNLSAENINFTQDELEVTLAEKSFSSKQIRLEKYQNDKIIIDGNAELSLANFNAFYQSKKQTLASFEKLRFDNISFRALEQMNTIGIDKVDLTDLVFSNNISDDIAPLVQFSNLALNQISLTTKAVNIADIALSDLEVDAQLDKDKTLVNLIDYFQAKSAAEPIEPAAEALDKKTHSPEKSGQAEKTNEVASQPSVPDFFIKLGEFRLQNSANIHFTDGSFAPKYQRKISITSFTVGPFDNQQPAQDSIFSIIGKSDKYAHLNLSGALRPFAVTPYYMVEGFIKELSLPGISPYIKETLGYEINSGQLDLSLNVSVDDSIIDGDTNILLRGIELTGLDTEANDTLIDSTLNNNAIIPFNLALNMLKDSDDNVDLTIPLTGDTNSPNFGVSGLMTLLLKQATMSAAKEYLISTLVPYSNVVKLALAAGEFALKMRINDLTFEPKMMELPLESQAFIREFSILMKDKKVQQVKLCAIATPADIGKTTDSKMSNNEVEQLKAISNKRVHAFKDHMVNKENIESARLLLCTPKVDSSKNAKSRITFVI
jgi:hypothetical protein